MAKNNPRQDGYVSAMLNGRTVNNLGSRILTTMVYDAYETRGLASAIVDRPAEDALAQGVEIENDDEDFIHEEFERLRIIEVFTRAMKMALLSGAAAILPIMDDAPALDQPFDGTALRRIRHLRAISGDWIHPTEIMDLDPESDNFGYPEMYEVRFPGASRQIRIHYTRLIPVPGEGAYMSPIRETVPWRGRSALVSSWVELQDYYDVCRWAILILERKQSPVYGMKGLADLLLSGDDGEKIAQQRVSNVDAVRNTLRTVVIDSEDEYNVQDLSLTAIRDVIVEAKTALAGASRTPVSILFGESPKGMNATGDSEMSIYQGRVTQMQKNCLDQALISVINIICLQPGQTWPDDWELKFCPLWKPSEKEEAEVEKLEAETKKLELESIVEALGQQLISPEEARTMIIAIWPEFQLPEVLPPQKEDPEIDPLLADMMNNPGA